MDTNGHDEMKKAWQDLTTTLSARFGETPDLQAILFLVGVQELGQGYRSFSKSEKEDLIHIAICRLLSTYGYYEFQTRDADGWPHWKLKVKLPHLTLADQTTLLKRAVVEYFEKEMP